MLAAVASSKHAQQRGVKSVPRCPPDPSLEPNLRHANDGDIRTVLLKFKINYISISYRRDCTNGDAS